MVVWGMAAALVSAVILATGAQFQNRGVQAVNDASEQRADAGFSIGQLIALVRTRRWLLGTGLFVVAIALQLTGLLLAPLAVVQPLGVFSLVATALLNRRIDHTRLERAGVRGIALCIVGTALFVVVAALTTTTGPSSDPRAERVLVLGGIVLVVTVAVFLARRRQLPAVAFAVGGGVCFGFVATLMKIVLTRGSASLQQHGSLLDSTTPLTLVVLAGVAVIGSAGSYLVQTAYSAGSADLVVAALTVIDPLVAVTIGIVLLGEARGTPPWAFPVFVVAEAVAVVGVVQLARHQPQPIEAGSR